MLPFYTGWYLKIQYYTDRYNLTTNYRKRFLRTSKQLYLWRFE